MLLLLSSCAEKTSYYHDAFEMNRVRLLQEDAEGSVRKAELATTRLAEQNAELRKVLEQLSGEVEKVEQEAQQCQAGLERLGVKVSGAALPRAKLPD